MASLQYHTIKSQLYGSSKMKQCSYSIVKFCIQYSTWTLWGYIKDNIRFPDPNDIKGRVLSIGYKLLQMKYKNIKHC